MKIFDDLQAEHERVEAILASLDERQWLSPSAAAGWSVADVVLHLAQTDESAALTARTPVGAGVWHSSTVDVDSRMETLVNEERAAPAVIFARWKAAARASVAALRAADPNERVQWVAAPLKPATLATTRLAELWAHTLDIAGPLDIEYEDTDRLRHIAWLGHSTLPYAFGLAGATAPPVHCELVAPSGDLWRFGPDDAESRIVGPAGDFCRIGAQRLRPEDSRLLATGPHAADALAVLRNYAS